MTTSVLAIIAALVLCCVGTADRILAAEGPSFNCTQVTLADDIAICADEELSNLDRAVNDAYLEAKSRVSGLFANPIGRLLIGERRQCGADKACLLKWHEDALRRYATLGTERTTEAAHCTVADPTDTELAVRATPRGRKLSTLPDGREVNVLERMNDDRGLPWARLDYPVGWVFADYLNCNEVGPQSPKISNTEQSASDVQTILRNSICTSYLIVSSISARAICNTDGGYYNCKVLKDFDFSMAGGIAGVTECVARCKKSKYNKCNISESFVAPEDSNFSYDYQQNWGSDFWFRTESNYISCHTYINALTGDQRNKSAGFSCSAN